MKLINMIVNIHDHCHFSIIIILFLFLSTLLNSYRHWSSLLYDRPPGHPWATDCLYFSRCLEWYNILLQILSGLPTGKMSDIWLLMYLNIESPKCISSDSILNIPFLPLTAWDFWWISIYWQTIVYINLLILHRFSPYSFVNNLFHGINLINFTTQNVWTFLFGNSCQGYTLN